MAQYEIQAQWSTDNLYEIHHSHDVQGLDWARKAALRLYPSQIALRAYSRHLNAAKMLGKEL